jgi:hypothetical protein
MQLVPSVPRALCLGSLLGWLDCVGSLTASMAARCAILVARIIDRLVCRTPLPAPCRAGAARVIGSLSRSQGTDGSENGLRLGRPVGAARGAVADTGHRVGRSGHRRPARSLATAEVSASARFGDHRSVGGLVPRRSGRSLPFGAGRRSLAAPTRRIRDFALNRPRWPGKKLLNQCWIIESKQDCHNPRCAAPGRPTRR